MNLGRLLIAAAIMAGLGGVVFWSNRAEKAKADKPAADASPKILSLKESDIKQIEITKKGEPPTVIAKNNAGQWAITAPKPLQADQGSITSITGAVSGLSSNRVVDDNVNPSSLGDYGLAPAVVSAKFTTNDGKTSTLLVGEDTPGGNDVYAKVEGDPRLFTMGSYNKSTLNKDYKDLRDKHLMTFDKDKTSRIELAGGQGPIEFGRIGTSEWQILKPKPMRADSFQVEDLLGRAHDAEMAANLSDDDEKKYVASFASGQPVGTLTVTDPSGSQKLDVRKVKDDYYAKSSAVDSGVQKLGADFGKMLEKKVDDFRNKKLFDFGFNDPSHIEVKDSGKDTVVDKSGENWQSGGKNMDSLSVQNAIDKIRELQAAKFVDTGFTMPIVELTVVSDSGKRTEKVQIAQAGMNFIAKRDGDASLYQLDAMPVADLRKAIGDIKPAAAPEPAKKK